MKRSLPYIPPNRAMTPAERKAMAILWKAMEDIGGVAETILRQELRDLLIKRSQMHAVLGALEIADRWLTTEQIWVRTCRLTDWGVARSSLRGDAGFNLCELRLFELNAAKHVSHMYSPAAHDPHSWRLA